MNWRALLQAEQIFPAHSIQDQLKRIELYIAKDFEESEFRHPLLSQIVQEARKSYWASYGETIPLLDKYDRKSSVFFTLTTFLEEHSERELEEILSLRFTPVQGDPIGNYDVDLYHFKGQPEKKLIEELLEVLSLPSLSSAHFHQRLFSISRLCAVRPHAIKNGKQFPRNSFTAESFALMTKYFSEEFLRHHADQLYLTTQMKPKMEEKLRTESFVDKRLQLMQSLFPLHLYGSVAIHRQSHEKYVYQYPGYFMDVEQLTKELHMLMDQGKLMTEHISSYIDTQRTWEEILDDPQHVDYRGLGDFFVQDGQITRDFSYADLRSHLNGTVSDGSQLYYMEFNN